MRVDFAKLGVRQKSRSIKSGEATDQKNGVLDENVGCGPNGCGILALFALQLPSKECKVSLNRTQSRSRKLGKITLKLTGTSVSVSSEEPDILA